MNFNKPKQSTLFQSWGKKDQQNTASSKKPNIANRSNSNINNNNNNDDIINLCEDDEDEMLAQVLDESLMYADHLFTKKNKDEGNISFGLESEPQFSVTLPGFDRHAGKLWIYPTNYPVRDYQYNIVSQALFKNTMVTLPTGLGKTFIASVVMYNYYRWYPRGKIIFMAPTKPLVAQQIEACYNIMGIPQADTAEMTGNMVPNERLKAWKGKRVFFLTPQVITNDLSRGSCPADDVKCVVVDEAHKALGNHAYCQVIRELSKYTSNFRVLALSATPGSDIKAVQQVLTNLLISHIEIRTEDSIDIKPYTHERKVDKVVVPLGEELNKVKTKYIQIMEVVIKRLNKLRVVYNRPTTSFSKFLLLKSRDEFRQNPPESLNPTQFGVVEGDFAMAISLYHGFELLQLHGLRSLYNYLDGIVNTEKGYGRTKAELIRNADFNDIMNMLSQKFSKYDDASASQKPSFIAGHPKMEKLLDIAIQHFEKFQDRGGTRIMIFSQYRDSVLEITTMLNQHPPSIKAMSFIGQSSVGKAAKGFTQKEQLRVMKEFREGGYNTLVSTCVGEEGLDIGDVDLIICFDAHKSPIRLVQRMGRTGRKREGRIVMLVTEGKEEQIYNQSQYSKKSIHKAILNGGKSLQFYQHNPRMIPNGLTPQCHKMYITVHNSYRNTKPSKTGNSSKQSTVKTGVSNKVKKAASRREETGDITLQEYRDLQEYFDTGINDIKLPVVNTDILSLGIDKQKLIERSTADNSNNRLSVSEWIPWQNRLQDTHSVQHSNKSKQLVEIVQFLELQETLGDDEDNYGIEMRMFLNDNDINKSNRNQSDGIKQYCQSKDKETSESERKRYSDRLPDIEVEEFNESEDSAEELPKFESVVSESNQIQTANPEFSKNKSPKEVKSSKKKKKRHSSTERSVHFSESLEMDDDFEDNGLLIKSHLQTSFKNFEKSTEMHENCESDADLCMVSPPSTPVKDSHDEHIELPSRGRCYVKTPPPIEEVAAIFDKLGDTEVPYVSIVELVDKWHEEEQMTSSSDSAKSRTVISFDSKPKMSVCTSPLFLRNDHSSISVPNLIQNKNSLNTLTHNNSVISHKPISLLKPVAKLSVLNPISVPNNERNKENEEFCDIVDSQEDCEVPFRNISDNCELPSINIRHRPSFISPKVHSESKPKHSPKSATRSDVYVKRPVLDTQSIEEFNTEIDREVSSPVDSNMCNSEGITLCQRESPDTVKNIKDSEKKSVSPVTKVSSSFVDAEMFNDSMFEKDLTLPAEFRSHHELDGTQFNLTQALSFLDKTDSSFRTQTELKVPVNKCNTIMEKMSSEDFSSSPVFGKSQNCYRNNETTNSQAFIPQDFEEDMTCDDFNDEKIVEKVVTNFSEKSRISESESKNSKHECSSETSKTSDNQSAKVSPVFISKAQDHDKMADKLKANESLADLFDDEIEMPQFDLGFDLEDDDEDDMIPPSPESNTMPHSSQNITAAKSESNHCKMDDKNNSRKSTSLKKCYQNNKKQEYTPDKFSSIDIGSPILNSAKKDQSLSVFEKIKLKNSPALQSLSSFNKQSVVSDRVSLKCSTPLKDLCVNNHITSKLLHSPLTNKQDNFESSFSILSPSSAKKPKFENKSPIERSLTQLPLPNIGRENSSIEHSTEEPMQKSPQPKNGESSSSPLDKDIKADQDTKQIIKQLITSTQGDPGSDNDLFEDDQDLDDIISNQREILDNIRKNNMGLNTDIVDEVETDEGRNDNVNELNVSLKSKLSLKIKASKTSPTRTGINEVSNDEDDSFLVKRRKKSRKIESPEFKTPTKPARKKVNPLNISSEEENEVNKILDLESLRQEEYSDDDFDISDTRIQNKKEEKITKVKKKKKRERGGGCMFIEDEADISDNDEISTDESYDSDHQQLSGNFINDDTQYDVSSQSHNHSDVHAMYLKSVRSPVNKGRYRLQYNYQHHDVYSQVPKHDEHSEYLEDSFCVDNDYEEDSLLSPEEISVIEQKRKPKEKPKAQNLNEVKGKKRLRKMSQSSSDDEMRPVIPLTQNTASFRNSQPMTKIKKRTFFSSSEDEEQSTSKAVLKSCEKLKTSNSVLQSNENSNKNSVDQRNRNDVGNFQSNLTSKSVSDHCVEIPNFDLELDFSDDDMPPPPVENSKQSTKLNQGRSLFEQTSDISRTCLSDQDKLKQERLEKQRKLQEKFKSRLEQQKTSENETVKTSENMPGDSNMSSIVNSDSIVDDFIIESKPKKTAKFSILVDSREISGAQEIISNLRIKHNINVEVRQLSYCDYILSTRLAVDRLIWSEFSNGSNHSKVIERLQKMKELYDRCCLIIETDKIKTGDNTVRKQHRSKYVDQLICTVNQSDIRLLFTDSQEETCNILVELCELESKKGQSITTPLSLDTNQQQMLKFYLSIPKVTYIQAVNFIFNFKSVSQFLNSSAKVLEINGKLSAVRSLEIYNYINRKFDLQMLPTKR